MRKYKCYRCGEPERRKDLFEYTYPKALSHVLICHPCWDCITREESIRRSEQLTKGAERRRLEVSQKSLSELQPENRLTKPVTHPQEDKQLLKALWSDLTHYKETGEWDVSEEEASGYANVVRNAIYREGEEDVN